jgi:hypothetical protein
LKKCPDLLRGWKWRIGVKDIGRRITAQFDVAIKKDKVRAANFGLLARDTALHRVA